MSVVALASAKGSPGVTTTALALASVWSRRSIVLEADPAGGDLAARLGLPEEPGLVGLCAALRRDARAELLERYVQGTPLGMAVVPAPAGAHQAAAASAVLGGLPVGCLTGEWDVLLDAGRLDKSSPGRPLVESADLLIWVCRPQLGDLAHLAAALTLGQGGGQAVSIVLIGAGPYPAEEVSATLGVTVTGQLPADPVGAATLWGSRRGVWGRSALGRSARSLAETLGTVLVPPAAPSTHTAGEFHELDRSSTIPEAGSHFDIAMAETPGAQR
ncbi:MAG TPA: hypothetical protein VN820_02110 [Acidimicrobiales bacterium]|nr:hypothetical protein [Acidimicrobiales bacterium]